MLHLLKNTLDLPFMNYLSIQFGISFGISFLIMLLFGNTFINWTRKWQKRGQPIRDDGPQTHLAKAGTPTMGGILIVASILASSLIAMDYSNPFPWIALGVMTAFAMLGFADDWGKVYKQSAYKGLRARTRLIIEGFVAIGAAFAIDSFMPASIAPTSIYLPIFNDVIIPLGLFYFVFAFFVIGGTANATNITDGLDGMLSKIYLTVMFVMLVVTLSVARLDLASYMTGPYIPDATGLIPVIGATIGAVLGFLWFNSKPAQIFMGDVGSLALGGLLGTIAMITKHEIIMGIAAGMMVLILMSSFLQIYYFKFTGGKRLFKMAPLHHHFEQLGWAETKVVTRFWIISILFCCLALALLKA